MKIRPSFVATPAEINFWSVIASLYAMVPHCPKPGPSVASTAVAEVAQPKPAYAARRAIRTPFFMGFPSQWNLERRLHRQSAGPIRALSRLFLPARECQPAWEYRARVRGIARGATVRALRISVAPRSRFI